MGVVTDQEEHAKFLIVLISVSCARCCNLRNRLRLSCGSVVVNFKIRETAIYIDRPTSW